MTASLWNVVGEIDALRWSEDMCVCNSFGEYVWLKPLYREGTRIGITECCFAESPCEYHATIANVKDKNV